MMLVNRSSISAILVLVTSFYVGACSTITTSYMRDLGEDLSMALNTHNDIDTVAAALPAYLLLIDSKALKPNSSAEVKLAGAYLYTAYSSLIADDIERQQRLSQRALHYALNGSCQANAQLCGAQEIKYQEFEKRVSTLEKENARQLYILGLSWVNWINANKDDWAAVAQLAQVKFIMNKVIQLDETVENGGAHWVLGIINTLVPPSMGGKPEVARKHFEQAIALSNQQNLSYKVDLAEHYARLVFDKELHDRLLKEVLAAEISQNRFTLYNTIAKKRAKILLAGSDDYF